VLLRKNRAKLTSKWFHPSVKLRGVNCSGSRPVLLAISGCDLSDVPTIQASG
jgi:hypothetical protein